MTMMDLINEYMAQSGNTFAYIAYDEHHNGSVHTNSSGSHADTKGPGGAHGDHVDRGSNY